MMMDLFNTDIYLTTKLKPEKAFFPARFFYDIKLVFVFGETVKINFRGN